MSDLIVPSKSLGYSDIYKDKKALCAFTSQQACLFGGPLLIIIKALAIVKAARRYSEQLI